MGCQVLSETPYCTLVLDPSEGSPLHSVLAQTTENPMLDIQENPKDFFDCIGSGPDKIKFDSIVTP